MKQTEVVVTKTVVRTVVSGKWIFREEHTSKELHVDGSHCTDYVALTVGTRPTHVAAKDRANISLELRVFSQPEREEGAQSIGLREQHRRQVRRQANVQN